MYEPRRTLRNWFKYHFKIGDEIVRSGITQNLARQEIELRKRWPAGRIEKVGQASSRRGATQWERRQPKSQRVSTNAALT